MRPGTRSGLVEWPGTPGPGGTATHAGGFRATRVGIGHPAGDGCATCGRTVDVRVIVEHDPSRACSPRADPRSRARPGEGPVGCRSPGAAGCSRRLAPHPEPADRGRVVGAAWQARPRVRGHGPRVAHGLAGGGARPVPTGGPDRVLRAGRPGGARFGPVGGRVGGPTALDRVPASQPPAGPHHPRGHLALPPIGCWSTLLGSCHPRTPGG
jgi:hypothetical protein